MLMLLTAAAANLMALPTLQTGTLKPDFKPEFNAGGGGAVQVRLVVSPSGVPIRCDPAFVNGPRSNAEAFCSMLASRTRFSPARDEKGQATYGVIYLWSHWSGRRWRGNNVPSWDPVNLALPTNKMPDGFPEGSMFRLLVQANPEGFVGGRCGVMSAKKITDQLAQLLCDEAAAQPVLPAMDERGNAVASVQEFIIRLTSQAWVDKIVDRLRRH